ncbi:hypothetical protein P170DRAFT_514532 [Aspergillus steynii IBT 23096]|uniref:Uncharacterized protein n=1 Tax=Aspergillus steynii IBT 23096 TaxID=1392250 RepID=A0A2I2FRK9_9EURO|nr:uncharacterized protein P170DRAFT_514532 [Aspergillus steynii IBT 23096]PLB43270.1 hypothetical protein P170DRAFT_514532 [Aspergillus steynii IBT 23096]
MSAYEGFWINRDQPAITGCVLTLSSLKSGFLLTFLALFVNATGQAFWRILCFILHQLRSTPGPHDGVYIQQQVILRNADLPLSAVWDLVIVMFSWRGRARRLYSRSMALVTIATVNLAVWKAAGIFSAKLAMSSDADILLQSPRCGLHAIKIDQARPDRQLIIKPIRLARDYAQQCYEDVPSAESICRTFVSKSLPWKSSPNASCPFARNLCIGGESAAFEMDTGMLDSHVHLGLNAPPKDRIFYRKNATCAPLDLTNYTEILNGSYPDHKTINFYLQDPSIRTPTVSYNISLYGTGDYYLTTVGPPSPLAIPGTNFTTPRTWTLRDALRRDDAVVSFLFLFQNSVYYPSAVDDPFFSAHFASQISPNITYYQWDHPITVLGCIEQHQICNPQSSPSNPNPSSNSTQEKGCTPLNSPDLIPSALTTQSTLLSLSKKQHYTAILTQSFASTISIPNTIYALGSSALRAQETLSSDLGNIALPSTQWHIESAHLFNITLAAFQYAFVDYVSPPAPFSPEDKVPPVPGDLYDLTCGIQKVRSSGEFVSFRAVGLVVVFGVGGLVIAVNFVLDDVVGYVRGWYGGRVQRYKRAMWAVDGKLQLLRLAYEGKRNGGVWEGVGDAVPVTGWGEVFDVEELSGDVDVDGDVHVHRDVDDGGGSRDGGGGGGGGGAQDQYLLGSWGETRRGV